MKWIIKLLLPRLISIIKKDRLKFIRILNNKVDLPVLDEEQEKKLLNGIFDTILSFL